MPRIRADSIAEHKELTRRDILDAAGALFRSQGFSGTSLGEVAAYVGIGRTTLYEYFEDKEDIVVQLVEDSLPALIDEMIAGIPDGLGCRARLTELIGRGLEFVSSRDNVGSMLMRELPALSPETQHRVRAVHQRLAGEITDVVRKGVETGEFGPYDPMEVGRIVFSVMMSASQSVMRGAAAGRPVEETAGTLLRFVFGGLAG